MSLTPINLNKARKLKARAEAAKSAAENRIAFGRTKAEKQASTKTASKAAQRLDGHKRDR